MCCPAFSVSYRVVVMFVRKQRGRTGTLAYAFTDGATVSTAPMFASGITELSIVLIILLFNVLFMLLIPIVFPFVPQCKNDSARLS